MGFLQIELVKELIIIIIIITAALMGFLNCKYYSCVKIRLYKEQAGAEQGHTRVGLGLG